MPEYSFSNPSDPEEIISLFQGMAEEHKYEKDGVVWDRVWTVPNGVIDAKIDPFSSNAFVDKAGAKGDTMGSLYDRSKEMSEKRKDKLGYDPVKQKYFENYSKKRRGRKNINQIKEDAANIKIKI